VAVFTVLLFRSDALSRGVALVILGACIGLWIVILERAMAQGLLKVVSGRMEGREFVLDKPTLSLGSDERGDIALFGDPASLPRHATLRQQGRGFAIEALPGAMLTVNGQPVGQATLASGDRLTVGSTRLIYRDKATAPAQVPALVPPEPAPASPSWSPPPVWAPPAAPQPLGSPVAAGMLSLLDPTTGQRFALRQGLTTIGRAPDNDIVLTHPSVSAHHAEVRYEAGRHIVHDKGSTNGTFVNGRRVLGPNMIKAGWTVQFGEQELRAM
jgi:predicted component of type VI protein secretion system